MCAAENPLQRIIDQQGFVVLDGGLATTLEARGHILDDALWSARVLLEDPEAIRRVHRDFLNAGADCLITSTYQASLTGFARLGLDTEAGAALMHTSVDLAREASRAFLEADDGSNERPRPLVAAGIGPYGAFLADGSEYTGRYDLDDAGLQAFHHARWRILAESSADLLACETIPSLREAAVLLSLLADTPDRWAWLSFSCRNGIHLNDGARFDEAVALCAELPRVAAVGVNCTSLDHVASLIAAARQVTTLPIIVYPNSGETYEIATRTWRPGPIADDWDNYVREWYGAGARGVGGCCRVGPGKITRIRRVLRACVRS